MAINADGHNDAEQHLLAVLQDTKRPAVHLLAGQRATALAAFRELGRFRTGLVERETVDIRKAREQLEEDVAILIRDHDDQAPRWDDINSGCQALRALDEVIQANTLLQPVRGHAQFGKLLEVEEACSAIWAGVEDLGGTTALADALIARVRDLTGDRGVVNVDLDDPIPPRPRGGIDANNLDGTYE